MPGNTDTMAFDASSSHRSKDDNGYLRVSDCNISKEQVVPYWGAEIPRWEELGLERDKKYYMYRPAREIKKAIKTFNGLPLAFDHHKMNADSLPKEYIIGSVGTEARFEPPYLKNSIIITDGNAIDAVERGDFRELSAAYLYDPVMKGGIFQGQPYDGVMTNLRGNHVALVKEGRAGHDVVVEDAQISLYPPSAKRKEKNKPMSVRQKLSRLMAYDAMPGTGNTNVNIASFMNALQCIEAINQGVDPQKLGFGVQSGAGVNEIVDYFFADYDEKKKEAMKSQLGNFMSNGAEAMSEDEDIEDNPDDMDDDFENVGEEKNDMGEEEDDMGEDEDMEDSTASGNSGRLDEFLGESGDDPEMGNEDINEDENPDGMTESPSGMNPAEGDFVPNEEGMEDPSEDADMEEDPDNAGMENTETPEDYTEETEEEDEEDYSDAMDSCGLDSSDPDMYKAFSEGAKYGKGCGKGGKRGASDGCGAKDRKCATDSANTVESVKAQLLNHYKALNKAAYDCRTILGELRDPLAFDSASAIYKKALNTMGISTRGVHPSAFASMLRFAKGNGGFGYKGVSENAAYDSNISNTARERAIEALSKIDVQ